jgi:hypothetical protein
MKTLGRIVIIVLILMLVASIWASAHFLGKVQKLANSVETDAKVMHSHLESEDAGPEAVKQEDFTRGAFLSYIQEQWERGANPREYPQSILKPTLKPLP